eukprot:PhF_6_TR10814/c1_g1_i1/m.17424/K01768/E4.6.1.1; adenylate cyclase
MGISIRLTLALFVVVVAVTYAILVWLGVSTANDSTNNVVVQLRDAISHSVVKDFTTSMTIPLTAVEHVAFLIRNNWLNIYDDIAVSTQMYKHLTLWPYTAHYVGTENSFFFSYFLLNDTHYTSRIKNGTNTSLRSVYAVKKFQPFDWFVGNLFAKPSVYNTTQRVWYVEQKAVMYTVPKRFSSVYPFALDGAPGTTATAPLFDPNGVFVGVAGVDMTLAFLSDMIRNTNVGEHTVSYIVEENGDLIAASHGPSGGANTRLNSRASPNTNIRESAKAIDFKTYHNTNATTRLTMDISSSIYWIDIVPLRLANLNWYYVTVFDENDFMSFVKESSTRLIIIACVVSCFAFIIGIAGAIGITSPLHVLEEEMASVACMDLEHVELTRTPSALSEVNSMQKSFVQMCKNLIEYRNYMPASILAAGDDEEEEQQGNDDIISQSDAGGAGSPVNVKPHAAVESSRGSSGQSAGQRSRKSNTESRMATKKHNATSMEIKQRKITVLVVNLTKWHKTVDNLGSSEAAAAHSSYIQKLVALVSESKGTPDVFLGDRFIATWNSIRPIGTHRSNACSVAVQIKNSIVDISSHLQCTAGVSSSDARCGNMGCDGMKKFTFLGGCASLAHILERLNKKYLTSILIDGAVEEEAKNNFTVRMMDHILLRRLQEKVIRIYEVCGTKKVSEDEWMYQLEEGESKDPSASFNAAVAAYVKGSYSTAKQALTKNTLADDQSTRLAALLEKMIADGMEGKAPDFTLDVAYF